MKVAKLAVASILLLSVHSVKALDLDAALAKASDDISGAIVKSSVKKVSVVDFTDLQWNNNEFGRYVAEQLSILLVNSNKDFAVLDRANLKSLLDEHKLTAKGLVNPENARKLGQFAGVDALILGNITQFGDNLVVTAKAISTESSQVIGATRVLVERSKEIDALLEVATQANITADAKQRPEKDFDMPNGMTVFDDFSLELVSFKFTDSQGILVLFRLSSKNKNNELAVGLNWREQHQSTFLVDENGTIFPLVQFSGIGIPGYRHSVDSWIDNMREDLKFRGGGGQFASSVNTMERIAPDHSIVFTLNFGRANRGAGKVFRFHSEIIVVEGQVNAPPKLKMNNVVMTDIRPR